MKIATVCSGIGSPEQALKELNITHEIAFACEIDKYARQTYLANFTPNQMYQDLTAEEWDKPEQYSDLFIGGIPCQAFSLAGKRLGELDKRGLLFYDFYRYVKNQQPKVFIIENVKGLLSDNNGITFQNWCALLGRSMNTHVNMFNHDDSLLYNLHFKVLNSKDFAVPQNRERVFLVGIRNDLPNTFRFPIGERLTKRLKDILEPEVDEKYYLSDTMLKGFANHAIRHKEKGSGFSFNPKNPNEIGNCITARVFKMGVDDNYIIDNQNDIANCIRASATPNCPTDNWVSVPDVLVSKEVRTSEAKAERRESGTNSFRGKEIVFEKQDYMNCLQTGLTNDHFIAVKEATKQGYAIAKEGDSINLSNPNSETRRGRAGDQIANTLDTACNQGVVVDKPLFSYRSDNPISTEKECFGTLRANAGGKLQGVGIIHETKIRRLTPLECMRLQGYPDSFTDTIKTHNIINKQGILIIFKEKNIWENVQLKTVKGSVKQKDIALCTIKELENMEMQTSFSSIAIGEMKNVKFKVAIEVLTVLDIAQHITTLTENTEIHFTGRKSLKKYELEKVQQEGAGGLDQIPIIELLFNVTLEENLKRENAYIILIVIPIIMKLATCMFSNHKKNTIAVILNYKNLPKNYSKQECLLLKMGNTLSISDSQTYKQAGNSITVNVMKAIIKNIIPIL